MPAISDYLDFRGDLSFAERPFNDVDNVILSCLSYVDFSGIVPEEGSGRAVRLDRACDELLERSGGDISDKVRSLARIDAGFLRRLAASRRFGGALLHDYVDAIDEDRSLQFAALQITFSLGETYASFRGTDDTLVGWRENFIMSFTETGAQRSAAAYLGRACRRAADEGGTLLVGGHSKGGNLASFAAMKQPPALQSAIAQVWSNDGPEMAPDVEPALAREVLGARYRKVLPTYSIVGTLFDDGGGPRQIVRSSASGALQHDPMTWQVGPEGLVCADEFEPEGASVAGALRDWVSGIGLADRERFTDELFDALGAGGATTLDEVMSPSGLPKVLSALAAADDRTKQLAYQLVASYVGATADATWQSARQGAAEHLRQLLRPQG